MKILALMINHRMSSTIPSFPFNVRYDDDNDDDNKNSFNNDSDYDVIVMMQDRLLSYL